MANFKRKYQKHLCQLVLIYVITLNQLFWKLTKEKFTLREFNFGGAAKISSLLSIMPHITPWTLNEVSLQFQSTNISLLHMYRAHFSLPELYRQCCADLNQQNTVCKILVKIDVLNTCEAMIWSYFGIVFVLFFKKIANAVYTFPNKHALVH